MASAREAPSKSRRKSPISPRDPRLAGWRQLLTAHSLLLRRLDDELRAEGGLSLYEYSALLQLAEAPGRRQRMSELADGILLTRSGVTRLVDRLESDGLVERIECTSDGRGAQAVLTEEGLTKLRAASKVHLRGIEAYYFDRVSPQDQEVIGRTMKAVSDGVRDRSA
jgi:DNA-binding MarR family transcriptional regulator